MSEDRPQAMSAGTTTTIDSIAALEAVIGRTPPAMHLKVIDHLDDGALRWIAQSPLMFACFGGEAGAVDMTIGGAGPGFASGDARRLYLPLACLDTPALACAGAPFASLFLLPGIGETLRINGRVEAVEDGRARIMVSECYGHCAKALIRSELWLAEPCPAPEDMAAFVAASRFLALATVNPDGDADLSPKGDPAGAMARIEGGRLWFVDRPGNRRVDSFRNIVAQPCVALALIVPGTPLVLTARGWAQLTSDMTIREGFTVRDKVPALAIEVAMEGSALGVSAALERVCPWPAEKTSDIDPAKLFVEHIKRNKAGGLGATLARASLSIPGMTGLLKSGLEKDYKDNLY